MIDFLNIKPPDDLGCGTGSLMATVLEYFPDVEVIGIDFDPTVLFLSNARLMPFSHRAKIEYSKALRIDIKEIPIAGYIN